MIKKTTLTLLFALTLITLSTAQAYTIQLNIVGYKDSLAYLGNYYADKLVLADTAQSEDGRIKFEGTDPLKQGVYFLVSMDKKKLFEFLVDEDQYFFLNTPLPPLPENMEVEGSAENTLFYNYLSRNKQDFDRIKVLQTIIKTLGEDNDSIPILQEKIDSINDASIDYKLKLMEDHPSSLTALLFKLMREPEVPDFFLDDGRQDTLAGYLYYKQHFWDGIEFSDDRILRTPVFYRKLDMYMNQVIPKHPDSIINTIDSMIAGTGVNSDLREYFLWHFTNTYETSKVMGYDKIFVHMVDEYFTDTHYDWLHEGVQKNMIDRVNVLRNVLIGSYAPALVMADTSGQFVALRQIEADYILILFWTTTCGECKREVDFLKEYKKETDYDLEIYAVNTDTSFTDWKKYIDRKQLDWVHVNGNMSLTGDYHDLYDIYSTPVIYLLDRNKKIIAKRLPARRIPEFIERLEKNEYEKE